MLDISPNIHTHIYMAKNVLNTSTYYLETHLKHKNIEKVKGWKKSVNITQWKPLQLY